MTFKTRCAQFRNTIIISYEQSGMCSCLLFTVYMNLTICTLYFFFAFCVNHVISSSSDDEHCRICVPFVQFTHTYLKDYTFTKEFLQYIHEIICNKLPFKEKEICLTLAEHLTPFIVHDIGVYGWLISTNCLPLLYSSFSSFFSLWASGNLWRTIQ